MATTLSFKPTPGKWYGLEVSGALDATVAVCISAGEEKSVFKYRCYANMTKTHNIVFNRKIIGKAVDPRKTVRLAKWFGKNFLDLKYTDGA